MHALPLILRWQRDSDLCTSRSHYCVVNIFCEIGEARPRRKEIGGTATGDMIVKDGES